MNSNGDQTTLSGISKDLNAVKSVVYRIVALVAPEARALPPTATVRPRESSYSQTHKAEAEAVSGTMTSSSSKIKSVQVNNAIQRATEEHRPPQKCHPSQTTSFCVQVENARRSSGDKWLYQKLSSGKLYRKVSSRNVRHLPQSGKGQ